MKQKVIPQKVQSTAEEDTRKAEAFRAIAEAKDAEKVALSLCTANRELVARAAQQSGIELRSVEKETAARIEEGKAMRRQLQDALKDISKKIIALSDTLWRTNEKLVLHREPLEANRACESSRSARAGPEKVDDQVQQALTAQLRHTEDSIAFLEGSMAEEQDALHMLEVAQAELEADYQDKSTGLEIDFRCLNYCAYREASGRARSRDQNATMSMQAPQSPAMSGTQGASANAPL